MFDDFLGTGEYCSPARSSYEHHAIAMKFPSTQATSGICSFSILEVRFAWPRAGTAVMSSDNVALHKTHLLTSIVLHLMALVKLLCIIYWAVTCMATQQFRSLLQLAQPDIFRAASFYASSLLRSP